MLKILNFINGEYKPPVSGNFIDKHEPARGKVYSSFPDSDHQDIALAVESAKKAFPLWGATVPEKRAEILQKIADLIEVNFEEFVLAEVKDTGKPVSQARTLDIPRAIANFRFFSGAILHMDSEAHQTGNTAINYSHRRPLGVVGCISPWNLPLYLFSWKIAPALAAGNCVVAKPSEFAPMTAFLLAGLCREAGLPPGVLNIVHGLGYKAGQALVEHKDVKAISFTGGTVTGRKIAETAAPQFKKLSLELGGKNPNIIMADCNLEEAIEGTVRSSFSNQGQICLCGSRIFVEEKLYDIFRTGLLEKTKSLKLGDPFDPDTQVGALISAEHKKKVKSYLKLAVEEGGRIITGEEKIELPIDNQKGFFMRPVIIEGLGPYCRTNREEIFGPVVTLIPFKTENEVIEYANCTDYGLSASIWTQNIQHALNIAHKLDSGIVWINCWLLRDLRTPFGGVKNSGMGREGGFEALKFFTEVKNVCIKL